MAQWGSASESGILRKNKPKDNYEDLLVFGYACKLFRDDEKASYIDKGNHLIPWMADDKLKIDRYDCRGALWDLTQYEASREGFDAMRWLGLNDSERKLEQLCDKERYYSLHINEAEEQMYKEEEEKRQKTKEFQYSYDVPTQPEMGPPPQEVEEETEDYKAPPHLDVPIDIPIPKTMKEHNRIEKTALFVYKQGPQMEILIKAKQADNPQFGFLNQGDQLYKYYRHVLTVIKNGRYEMKQVEKNEDTETATNDDHYLHPSLLSSKLEIQSTTIPTVPYKPSANCSYSQLVNRIQGHSQSDPEIKTNQMTYEQQQQYYQYYYTAQYYEYYKQMAQYQDNGQTPDLDPNVQNYLQQMTYNYQATNPYAQIVSNVTEVTNKNGVEKNTLLSLAQYGSDSDSETETVTIPTGETQVVIDKMATYVSKNGIQFEEIVRAKGDPRFEFLNETHEFYKYYKSKLKGMTNNDSVTSPKAKKVIAPVCFSIKKPKEDAPKEIKSALPVEESDEEGEKTPEPIVSGVESVEPILEIPEVVSTNETVLDVDDPLLEMIDLTDDVEEKKDAKRAEDKIKDKLAAAAREKMVSVARDRALQLERKKKAAAFLKLKSAEFDDAKAETAEDQRKSPKIVQIDDSDEEEEERKRKSVKKKKAHKRKHSKSKHESRSRKKSKKKRHRSQSSSSSSLST